MTIILTIFLLTLLIQISYWVFFYVNVSIIVPLIISKDTSNSPVSIVVCAKNEGHNIRLNYSSWVDQLSANDELIIVDDFSTDQSFQAAHHLSSNYRNCHTIKATQDKPGKKQALSDGIASSSNNYILVTDADCQPSKNWKTILQQHLTDETDFVLGYAPFYKHPTIINLFQRFECLLTAIQYFSYAQAGQPYMGVGRNMLFKKSIFDKEIYSVELASGDDDLLVSAKATRKNTHLCINPDSFVYSEAKPTLKTYLRQKLRHISSSTKYKPFVKFLLALFSATQILSHALLFFLLVSPSWNIAISLWIILLAIKTLTLKKTGEKFKEGNIYLFTPILDLTLTLYYLILVFTYPFKKITTWN